MAQMEEELSEALSEKQASCEEAEALARGLAEELERERGRLAGVHRAQATLRDHAGSLEAALAKKDYSIGQLSSQTANALAEKEAEDAVAHRKACFAVFVCVCVCVCVCFCVCVRVCSWFVCSHAHIHPPNHFCC